MRDLQCYVATGMGGIRFFVMRNKGCEWVVKIACVWCCVIIEWPLIIISILCTKYAERYFYKIMKYEKYEINHIQKCNIIR